MSQGTEPPSQSVDTGRPWLWNALSAGSSEGKVAHHQVLFPISLGLLTTHIIRSYFSSAFVRPQMMFPPSWQSSFCVLCQNNHLPKMMASLRNISALSLGNRKKEKKKNVKCLTWIDEVCWNYWIKWKLS